MPKTAHAALRAATRADAAASRPMAVSYVQQGSKGPLRDLDYINPRPPKAVSALPPEIRRRLGLDRGRSCDPVQSSPAEEAPEHYRGSANAAPKKGKSGAGTDWVNPNGHAFVRRGSGIPMSQRASRFSQLSGAGAAMIANQSKIGGERAPSRERAMLPPRPRPASREASALSKDCGVPIERFSPVPAAEVGYSSAKPAHALPIRSQSLGDC